LLKDLSRNESDIHFSVYWLFGSPKWDLGCVIQILLAIGFPKCIDLLKMKTLLENPFGKNRELPPKVLLNGI
jgi:hypothetical protein